MEDLNSKQEIGSLKYSIHFLWSLKEYHAMLAADCQTRIEECEAEIAAIEENLEKISAPFEQRQDNSISHEFSMGRELNLNDHSR